MRPRFSAVIALAAASGCAPNIETSTPAKVVVAEFDPAPTPPNPQVVPLPTDLVRDPKTGLLSVPLPDQTTQPALYQFDHDYLNTLDGFPPQTPVQAFFSDVIDPATLKPSNTAQDGSVAVFDATAKQALGPADYDLKLGSDGTTLTIVPHFADAQGNPSNLPWRLGHTYVVFVFGGADPQGIKGKDGSVVVASPTTFFMRSSRPLLTNCYDNSPNITSADCLCPLQNGAFATSCHPATGVTLAQATQLEPLRQQLQQAFATLLPSAGASKAPANVVLTWQFTIAHGPFAVFDPTTSRIPFPNDVLVDQTTKKVALPISPTLPAAQQAIYMGLNTLDGFSTTASETLPVDEADDNMNAPPVGLAPGTSALLFSSTGSFANFTATPQMINMGQDWDGLLQLTPTSPLLPDLTQYVAVVTNDVTDSKGRKLVPTPVEELVKLDSPLVDKSGHSTLPSVIGDADAARLEVLRTNYAPLWTQLQTNFGLTKDRVAMVWTFKTQSITGPLLAVAGYPMQHMTPTAVTIDQVQNGNDSGSSLIDPSATGSLVFGRMTTHVALNAMGVLDLNGGMDEQIPFVLATPKGSAAAPIVIAQHGFEGWRGDMLALSSAFNKAGWALIAIDINFHGARTVCTADADCDSGGTCTNGACSTKLACTNRPTLTYQRGGMTVTECDPKASGKAFLNLGNPFAIRDNIRQHTLDLVQLERVLGDTTATGLVMQLKAQNIALDPTQTAFVGQSLGSITGTLFLAAAPAPTVGVLSVPGGNLVDLFLHSSLFAGDVSGILTANMVAADTPAYYQLLDTFRWIVDPADPVNLGRYITQMPLGGNPPKKVIVQEAGMDMVIANANTDALVRQIGPPFAQLVNMHPAAQPTGSSTPVSTFFPTSMHGFLTDGEPSTPAAQAQAVSWISSNGASLPPPQ